MKIYIAGKISGEKRFEMQEKLEQENRKLAAMRDSLLPRLLSGEIDVADIGI